MRERTVHIAKEVFRLPAGGQGRETGDCGAFLTRGQRRRARVNQFSAASPGCFTSREEMKFDTLPGRTRRNRSARQLGPLLADHLLPGATNHYAQGNAASHRGPL